MQEPISIHFVNTWFSVGAYQASAQATKFFKNGEGSVRRHTNDRRDVSDTSWSSLNTTPLICRFCSAAGTIETPTSAATRCTMDTNCGTLGPSVGSKPDLRHVAITASKALGLSSRENITKTSSRKS